MRSWVPGLAVLARDDNWRGGLLGAIAFLRIAPSSSGEDRLAMMSALADSAR